MDNIKIKAIWEDLVINDWGQNSITEYEDFDRLIYEVSNQVGLKFDVCWAGNEEQYLIASYYSEKLRLNIELDLDCFEQLESADDLLEFCERFNNYAEKVENSITINK